MFVFGEFSSRIEAGNLGFSLSDILQTITQIYQRISHNSSKCFLLNCIAKILVKGQMISRELRSSQLQVVEFFQ